MTKKLSLLALNRNTVDTIINTRIHKDQPNLPKKRMKMENAFPVTGHQRMDDGYVGQD
jgi:hypothetical protein